VRGVAAAAGSRPRRPWAAALALLGGCVALPADEADLAQDARPIVVSLPGASAGGEDRAVHEYYRGLLRRLHEAYSDADLPLLRRLLAGGARERAPEWARDRLDGFAALTQGLAFELHCRERATLVAPETIPAVGQPVQFRLLVPPGPGPGWVLGGEGDRNPASFRARFLVEDDFVDGSTRSHDSDTTLRMPRPVRLVSPEELMLPLELDLGEDGAVRRSVLAEIELLPGHVAVDGVQGPVRRTLLGRSRIVQYPAGHEAVRERPMDTLREAMRRGDPEHFRHVWLAAVFAPSSEHEAVLEALIGWVRIGRPDQQRVAMAALKVVTAAAPTVGDRESWLAWWQARR
jgi:hypothetical protein